MDRRLVRRAARYRAGWCLRCRAVAVRASRTATNAAGFGDHHAAHRVKGNRMAKYEIGPMPAQISAEVVALLEKTETATVGHWRHWGFCDRRHSCPSARPPRGRHRGDAGDSGAGFYTAAPRVGAASAGRYSGRGPARRYAARLLGRWRDGGSQSRGGEGRGGGWAVYRPGRNHCIGFPDLVPRTRADHHAALRPRRAAESIPLRLAVRW